MVCTRELPGPIVLRQGDYTTDGLEGGRYLCFGNLGWRRGVGCNGVYACDHALCLGVLEIRSGTLMGLLLRFRACSMFVLICVVQDSTVRQNAARST
jgi:hypothetical protein